MPDFYTVKCLIYRGGVAYQRELDRMKSLRQDGDRVLVQPSAGGEPAMAALTSTDSKAVGENDWLVGSKTFNGEGTYKIKGRDFLQEYYGDPAFDFSNYLEVSSDPPDQFGQVRNDAQIWVSQEAVFNYGVPPYSYSCTDTIKGVDNLLAVDCPQLASVKDKRALCDSNAPGVNFPAGTYNFKITKYTDKKGTGRKAYYIGNDPSGNGYRYWHDSTSDPIGFLIKYTATANGYHTFDLQGGMYSHTVGVNNQTNFLSTSPTLDLQLTVHDGILQVRFFATMAAADGSAYPPNVFGGGTVIRDRPSTCVGEGNKQGFEVMDGSWTVKQSGYDRFYNSPWSPAEVAMQRSSDPAYWSHCLGREEFGWTGDPDSANPFTIEQKAKVPEEDTMPDAIAPDPTAEEVP